MLARIYTILLTVNIWKRANGMTCYPLPFLQWIHYDLLQGPFESWTLVGVQTTVKYWLEPKIRTGSARTCPFPDISLESRTHSSKIVSIWPHPPLLPTLVGQSPPSALRSNSINSRPATQPLFNICIFFLNKQTFKPWFALAQLN